MKVKVLGKQFLNFTTDDGDKISGTKLHVVSTVNENEAGVMVGRRCATVFTKLDVSQIPLDSVVDLVYEQQLGSNKSRLVAIQPVK